MSFPEQFEEAVKAERMVWAALQATDSHSPDQVVLRALWRKFADEVMELSSRLNAGQR